MAYSLWLLVISLVIFGCNALTVTILSKDKNSTNVISLFEKEERRVDFILQEMRTEDGPIFLQISSKSGWTHATVRPQHFIFGSMESSSSDIGTLGLTEDGSLFGSFNITGDFVGFSDVIFVANSTRSKTDLR